MLLYKENNIYYGEKKKKNLLLIAICEDSVDSLNILIKDNIKFDRNDIKIVFNFMCKYNIYQYLNILINYYYFDVYYQKINKYNLNIYLHDIAFKNNSYECIEILIKNNIHFTNNYYDKRQLLLIKYNGNCDFLYNDNFKNLMKIIKYNALEIYDNLILDLIKIKYLKCVELLIDKNICNYESVYENYFIKYSIIYNIFKLNNYKLFEKIVKIYVKKKIPLNKCFCYGSLLKYTCESNKYKYMKLLLENGADPNSWINRKYGFHTDDVFSAIFKACVNPQIKYLKLLIKYKANVNKKYKDMSLFDVCLLNNNIKHIKYLIMHGFKYSPCVINEIIYDIINEINNEKKTTFMICILHKTAKHTISDFFKTNPGLYKYIGRKMLNYII